MENLDPKFEFQAPKFHDFTKNKDVEESYCQEYFDNKTKQMEKKLKEETNLEIYISPKIKLNSKKTNKNILKKNYNKNNKNDFDNNNDININRENNFKTEIFDKENKKIDVIKLQNESFASSKHSNSLIPISPKLKTKIRAKNQNKIKTSEEILLNNIEIEKEKYKKLKKLNKKNVLKLRSNNVFIPNKSLKLTIPLSPILKTELRAIKRNNNNNNIPLSEQKPRKIRKNNNNNRDSTRIKNNKKKLLKRKLTIPQSFKLNKSKTKCDNHSLTSDEIQMNKIKFEIIYNPNKSKKRKIE